MSAPIVKGTLRTAVETVAAVTPPPPAAPSVALPVIEPTSLEIESRAAVNGWKRAEARHHLILEAEAQFKDAQRWAPEVAKEILAERAVAHEKLLHSTQLLRSTAAAFGKGKAALIARASTRLEIAEQERQLADVQKRLDSQDSVRLSDGELFGLEHKRKLLPKVIADLRTKEAALASEIKSTLDGSGIDAALMLAFIKEQAGRGPGQNYPNDQHVLSLFAAGVLTMPQS